MRTVLVVSLFYFGGWWGYLINICGESDVVRALRVASIVSEGMSGRIVEAL